MILQYPTRCSECRGYMKAGSEADWLGVAGDYIHPEGDCPEKPIKRQNLPAEGVYEMFRCCKVQYGVPKGQGFVCPDCGRMEAA